MSELAENVVPLTAVQEILKHDEKNVDAADKFNRKYSPIALIILAIVVMAHQFVGERIECWAPAQFPEHWVEYTKAICWISNTYFIPMGETNILEANRKEIVYYQWVALVLFAQAAMFCLPGLLYTCLNGSLGLNVHNIVKVTRDLDELNPDKRDKTTKYLVKHIDRFLRHTKGMQTEGRLRCYCSMFLIPVYLFTKVLYIGNTVLQLYLLNHILDTNYTFYGIEVLQDISNTGGFQESRRFPRVTLCDFEERTLGRNIPHTVQCTLPINIFNEKIFIFVWFWLALMTVINILSFISWLWILFTTNRRTFIKKYLKIFDKYNKVDDRDRLTVFCEKYLGQDGHFALRMILKNSNEVVTGELTVALWNLFGRSYNHQRKLDV